MNILTCIVKNQSGICRSGRRFTQIFADQKKNQRDLRKSASTFLPPGYPELPQNIAFYPAGIPVISRPAVHTNQKAPFGVEAY
jgi:hypothetical protein